MEKPIILIWDNFGYMHNDRCEALAKYYEGRRKIIGIEIAGKSKTYNWRSQAVHAFDKVTLFLDKSIDEVPFFQRLYATISACLAPGKADVFLCHYDHPATFLIAVVLRALGRSVYAMNNSKFDDKARRILREAAKSVFFRPYVGALAAGSRSADYLRFHGLPESQIFTGYNTLSLDRIRSWSGSAPDHKIAALKERHFTVVARFVPKKNLITAIDAYDAYCRQVTQPHPLFVSGYGPLEPELHNYVRERSLEDRVIFLGALPNEAICRLLCTTLALILPSIEEQFGNVVVEAQALGLPVIVSENCGACDSLVRSGVNGFVVEPDNALGLAYFMNLLSTDEQLWHNMSLEARKFARYGDVVKFAEGVYNVLGR